MALNNPQRLIFDKTQQTKPNQKVACFVLGVFIDHLNAQLLVLIDRLVI